MEKENEPSKGSYYRRLEKIDESSSQTEKKETAASNIVASTSINQSESTQTDMEENKRDANKEKLGTQYCFPKFTVFSGEEQNRKRRLHMRNGFMKLKVCRMMEFFPIKL